MEFLNEPAYRGLREALVPLAVVGAAWWIFGSIPYLIGRRKRAAAAVRFLGLVAIILQGVGAFLAGELFTASIEYVGNQGRPGDAWWIMPAMAWVASFVTWVVAATIALMSRPARPARRSVNAAPATGAGIDFEITD